MKQIALDKLYLTPKLLITALVILTLSVFSMIATAADADVGDTGGKTLSERFNHMATGYPLTGQHAVAECGSCHVGGIFKGTARNCSGCHTKGQRVVATAMSSKHLVTTDPCEVCHTNTVTFYGARYNHGKAVPGQCTTCHNGFNATGRAASHTSGSKLTKSCDNCHRTYAWLPASWNHFGNTAKCVTCHVSGGEGAAFSKVAIGGTTPEGFAHNALNNPIVDCESCHHSYSSWYGARYDHSGAGYTGGRCDGCHTGTTRATGTIQKSGHIAIGSDDCSACHYTTATWSGALGAKPGYHIPYNPGVGCGVCHTGGLVAVSTLHANSTATNTCETCHIKPSVYADSRNYQKTETSHEGSSGNNCTNCHRQAGSYANWSH